LIWVVTIKLVLIIETLNVLVLKIGIKWLRVWVISWVSYVWVGVIVRATNRHIEVAIVASRVTHIAILLGWLLVGMELSLLILLLKWLLWIILILG
jgi:hypothetical protein